MVKTKQWLTSGRVLSYGLAFVFGYAALSSLLHPIDWIAYVPAFLTGSVAPTTLVDIIALFELVLAIWLFSGQYRKYAALASAALLAGIIVFNLHQMIITFRDVGLLCMAVALFLE